MVEAIIGAVVLHLIFCFILFAIKANKGAVWAILLIGGPLISFIALFAMKNQSKENEYIKQGYIPSANETSLDGMIDRLDKLNTLREKNVITEEEYKKMKDEIININK